MTEPASRPTPGAGPALTDPALPLVVGVVGAGTMGAGIAQVALEAGHEVVLHDVDDAAVERGLARIRDGLERRARSNGGLDVDEHLGRLRSADTLDALGAEPGLGLVVEAALEDLGLKQEVFRALDAATTPATILATNTSALSVAEIGRLARQPERVIGLHFFNPAPLMALVEVAATPSTDPAVFERAVTLMAAWGKRPVRCADTPGFIVNRVNRPFTIEALRIVEAGEAGIEAVDAAMRAVGFPMGPFELMDLTGIDVTLAAATHIWERLGRPDRLRPSELQRRLVERGERGRKDGRGFYRYDPEGRRLEAVADTGVPRADTLAADAIVERMRVALDREAAIAVEEGVATAADIELALRLGAGHPARPPADTAETGERDEPGADHSAA